MQAPAPECPRCGRAIPASAPRGLCPACLVASVIENATDEERSTAVLPAPAAANDRVGAYELLEQLGRGGMGVVFRARDRRLNRIVALKLLLAGELASDAEVKRFRTEAEAAAQLEHPNIVPIYEVGTADGRHFLAMKFIEGGTLAERCAAGSPALRQSSAMMAKVARAVHHAHQHGILHRDLKPANILLDERGEPFVTDFGLARREEGESDVTHSRDLLGTPGFLAPEVLAGGSRAATTSSDVYSLGTVFYELLLGRPPFVAESVPALLRKVAEEEPAPPGREVPRDLATICLKCLAKAPAQRYTSARALAEDLERWLRGEPILARPAGVWEQTLKWARRKPAWALVVSLLLLTPAVIIGVLLVGNARVRRAQTVTRENLYAADMQVAQAALEDANLGLARRILAAHAPRPGEPDLRGFEWRYLWQRAQSGQLRVLRAHTRPVECVVFAPDGHWLASSEDGPAAWLWSTTTWKNERGIDWSGPVNHQFKHLAFAPDSRTLVVTLGNDYAPVFDMATLKSEFVLRPHRPGTREAARVLWSPEAQRIAFLATAARGECAIAVLRWDEFLRRPGGGSREPGHALIEEARAGDRLSFPDAPVRWLGRADQLHSFTADGQLLANRDGELIQLDIERAGAATVIPSAHQFAYCERSADGRFLAGFNPSPKDRHSVLMDEFAAGRTNYWELFGHEGEVRSLAISPDSQRIVSGSADHTARVWEPVTRKTLAILRGHSDEVTAVAWSRDGQLIATGSRDRTVMLWSANSTNLTDLAPEPLADCFGPWVLAANGAMLAAGTFPSNQITVCNLATREQRKLTGNATLVPVRFTADTEWLFTLNLAATGPVAELRRWRLPNATNELLRAFPLPEGAAHEPFAAQWAMSPDHRWLARGDARGVVSVWPVDGGEVSSVTGPAVVALSFSPDAQTLAVLQRDAAGNGVATLRPTGSGGAEKVITLATGVNAFAWSPDATTLALACEDHGVQLWAAESRQLLRTLTGHKRGVAAVAFSPDGRTLASGDGRTIKLWHAATGRETITVFRDIKLGEPLRWLGFTGDGTRLLAADAAGQVQRFFAPPPRAQP